MRHDLFLGLVVVALGVLIGTIFNFSVQTTNVFIFVVMFAIIVSLFRRVEILESNRK